MSLEPKRVPEEIPVKGLGSLRGCLVDGDAEQRRRERSVRRRSLAISVVLQSAILAALLFMSLFGKGESIALANVTPIPPYSPYRGASHDPGTRHSQPSGPRNPCRFCIPPNISPTIVTHDSNTSGNQTDEPQIPGIGDGNPGGPEGFIPLQDSRQRILPPDDRSHQVVQQRIVHMTHLDPAMLIHRVEPVYPALAKQLRRGGRVELRAMIATDGSIQSLQVVEGDALFYQSAIEAVRQWRYRATVLNGQTVEIDTYITVLYTLNQ